MRTSYLFDKDEFLNRIIDAVYTAENYRAINALAKAEDKPARMIAHAICGAVRADLSAYLDEHQRAKRTTPGGDLT